MLALSVDEFGAGESVCIREDFLKAIGEEVWEGVGSAKRCDKGDTRCFGSGFGREEVADGEEDDEPLSLPD